MGMEIGQYVEDNWSELVRLLPNGWESKAKELKALIRNRGFRTVEDLLRALLIHLSQGYSLRVTSALCKESGLADVSDVALLNRLNQSGAWFLWMAQELRESWLKNGPPASPLLKGRQVRAIDGTTVQEPGAKGTTWRIHYSLCLSTLNCDEAHVTSPQKSESFKHFQVNEHDIFIADRGYASFEGIQHVLAGKGDVIVRYRSNLPLYDHEDQRLDLLSALAKSKLKPGEHQEWRVNLIRESRKIPCRICAIKKTQESAEKEKKRILRKANKNGSKVKPETLIFAEYTIMLTTLDESFSREEILEAYRQRWQIEIAFKRLKSLIQIGHLKKYDEEGSKAWIHGKLFLAMLIESFIRSGEFFFPWGCPPAVAGFS